MMSMIYLYLKSTLSLQKVPMRIVSGVLFGLVALLGMLNPVKIDPGLIYDGRSIILVVAGIFSGPLAAAIAAVICIAYRLWLGGPGVIVGIAVIAEATIFGILFHLLVKAGKVRINAISLLTVGTVVHASMLGLQFLLPNRIWLSALPRITPVVIIVYPLIFMLIALIFIKARDFETDHSSLLESELRYRNLFENNSAAMLLVDPESGSIVKANAAAVAFYGWNLEELTAMKIWEINLASKEMVEKFTKETLSTRRGHYVLRHRIASGEIRDIEAFLGVITIDGRNIFHIVIHDVSDREKILRERALLYQTIDQSSNEVFIFRADTLRITYASKGALKNLGYANQEILEMTPLDLKKAMPEKEFRSILEQLLSREKTDVTFLTKHWRSDGSTYPVEVKLDLHDTGKGKVFLAIITDITERQRASQEASSQLDELKRWHDVTLNREERIIGLKAEVNELCKKLGQAGRYDGEYLDDGL